MKPSATTSPVASTVLVPCSGVAEMAAMRSPLDANMASSIQPGFRVNHTTVGDDEAVWTGLVWFDVECVCVHGLLLEDGLLGFDK